MIFGPYRKLEKAIGYRFWRRARLEQALTHPSYRHEVDPALSDNQRLEFLGDAALGLVCAAMLYKAYPGAPEGDLTKLRSLLTSTKALADVAARVGLGAYLKLGKGELMSGGRERPTILADALEAVIGAAYLDGGLRAVERIGRALFDPGIRDLRQAVSTDNPKGELQEWAQARNAGNPRYVVTREQGPPHQRIYTVDVRIGNTVAGTGRGPNKRDAETQAAVDALARRGDTGNGRPHA